MVWYLETIKIRVDIYIYIYIYIYIFKGGKYIQHQFDAWIAEGDDHCTEDDCSLVSSLCDRYYLVTTPMQRGLCLSTLKENVSWLWGEFAPQLFFFCFFSSSSLTSMVFFRFHVLTYSSGLGGLANLAIVLTPFTAVHLLGIGGFAELDVWLIRTLYLVPEGVIALTISYLAWQNQDYNDLDYPSKACPSQPNHHTAQIIHLTHLNTQTGALTHSLTRTRTYTHTHTHTHTHTQHIHNILYILDRFPCSRTPTIVQK